MRLTKAVSLCLQHTNRMGDSRSIRLVGALSILFAGSAAHAAIFDGHGQQNGNWSTPANWVGDVVPTSGSPNLEVILGSSATTPLVTSNQDLATPFVLQRLTLPFGSTSRIVDGLPLAFSNLGGAPLITSEPFLSQVLTVNNDLVLNADLTVAPPGSIPSVSDYTLNGVISGIGGVLQTRGGRVFLGGTSANTYAGLTTVDDGVLYLNKPASVIAIPGDVVINTGGSTRSLRGSVIVGNDDQIAATSTVTLNQGRLFLEGGDQTLANINFTGENDWLLSVPTGAYISINPTRTLTITGNIKRAPGNLNFSVYSHISGGTLNLNGGLRSIRVDNGESWWPRTELLIDSKIVNGDIEKTGAGTLILGGSFSGNLHANEGLLRLGLEMTFVLNDGGASNRILGTAETLVAGTFVIDSAPLADVSGIWNLVDVANLNETFDSSLKVRLANGTLLTKVDNIYKAGRWEFSTADGNLTLAAPEPAALPLAVVGSHFAVLILRRRLPSCLEAN